MKNIPIINENDEIAINDKKRSLKGPCTYIYI